MATYAPTITVEMAFGDGPLEASPSWTDVSAYVQAASIRRGRASEFEQFTAGTLSLQLKDTARRFDPLNTAGPYYGQLVPNVPVRVTATYSATPYRRFYGFVDGWDVGLDASNRVAFVTVRATDAFKILARKTLPDPLDGVFAAAGRPIAWYRCGGDGALSTALTDSISGYDGTITLAGVTPVSGLRPRSADALMFPAQNLGVSGFFSGAQIGAPGSNVLFASPTWTVSALVQFGGETEDAYPILEWVNDSVTGSGALYVAADGTVALSVTEGSDTISAASTGVVDDGGVHHIVFVRNGTTGTIYIDGVADGTDTDANVTLGLTGIPAIEVVTNLITGGDYPTLTLDDLMFFDSALDSTEVGDLTVALNRFGTVEQSGDLLDETLDFIDWPAGARDIDTGEAQLTPLDPIGRSALEYMQTIAASEGGRMFIAGDGDFTFHDALTIAADTSSTATFSDDGSDSPYLAGSLRFTLDDRKVYNEAQVTREGGEPQYAADATSVAAYGPSTRSLTGLMLSSDSQALNLAERIVYRYKDPSTRAESWRVNPQAKPATWAEVLALDIGAHVTLEVRPLNTGARETLALDLEQIVELITPAKYELEFIGSPRDPNIGLYFEWGGVGATQGWGNGVWR